MKKSFNIGRDSQNDIIISDPSNLVSREHAVLKVDDKGHYKIMDKSTNGTYVNGIRLEKFVDVPVTRKDEITFASVAFLDWDAVPKAKKGGAWVIAAIVAPVLIILGLLAYILISNNVVNFNPWVPDVEETVQEKVDTFEVVMPVNCLLEWNQTDIEIAVSGNVEWKVSVTGKDGKPVEKVQIEPVAGKGAGKVSVVLPKNTSTKEDAEYKITVVTEAKVKTQSYELKVVQKKKQVMQTPPVPPKPKQNVPIL